MVARGEVWWVDLADPVGSEPGYRRPCIVISADRYNASVIRTVTIVSVTSNLRLGGHPGNVVLDKQMSGLDRDSVVNVTQIATVDRSQLLSRVGLLPPSLMSRIDNGLRLALEL